MWIRDVVDSSASKDAGLLPCGVQSSRQTRFFFSPLQVIPPLPRTVILLCLNKRMILSFDIAVLYTVYFRGNNDSKVFSTTATIRARKMPEGKWCCFYSRPTRQSGNLLAVCCIFAPVDRSENEIVAVMVTTYLKPSDNSTILVYSACLTFIAKCRPWKSP